MDTWGSGQVLKSGASWRPGPLPACTGPGHRKLRGSWPPALSWGLPATCHLPARLLGVSLPLDPSLPFSENPRGLDLSNVSDTGPEDVRILAVEHVPRGG